MVQRWSTGLLSLGTFIAAFLLGGNGVNAGSGMFVGNLTSQPVGHYEFCRLNPNECNIVLADFGPLQLTNSMWRELNQVNSRVNQAIEPVNDYDLFGKEEFWTFPENAGDCEDIVLEKRRILAQNYGIALSNLLITVVRKPDGEGHAVLTIRTDKGDLILDNLTDRIHQWNKTGYRFLKRQASTNTGRWVTLRQGLSSIVAAVR